MVVKMTPFRLFGCASWLMRSSFTTRFFTLITKLRARSTPEEEREPSIRWTVGARGQSFTAGAAFHAKFRCELHTRLLWPTPGFPWRKPRVRDGLRNRPWRSVGGGPRRPPLPGRAVHPSVRHSLTNSDGASALESGARRDAPLPRAAVLGVPRRRAHPPHRRRRRLLLLPPRQLAGDVRARRVRQVRAAELVVQPVDSGAERAVHPRRCAHDAVAPRQRAPPLLLAQQLRARPRPLRPADGRDLVLGAGRAPARDRRAPPGQHRPIRKPGDENRLLRLCFVGRLPGQRETNVFFGQNMLCAFAAAVYQAVQETHGCAAPTREGSHRTRSRSSRPAVRSGRGELVRSPGLHSG